MLERLLVLVSFLSVDGYPYYLNQFHGQHFQANPQPQVYPQQYQQPVWNQFGLADPQQYQQYNQYQQYPVQEYPQPYADTFYQAPQYYQNYGNPPISNADYPLQYNPLPHYEMPPQYDSLPQYPKQYETLPQYPSQYENHPRYPPQYESPSQYLPGNESPPQYFPNSPSQFPQYPQIKENIPEVGSSYVVANSWNGPVKYFIDHKGQINPPINPMQNIRYSGVQHSANNYPTYDIGRPGENGGGMPPINQKTEVAIPAENANEPAPTENLCNKMSCYINCRISLQGGGQCSKSGCQCYRKDGIKRPEDNTWFELSEEDQKRILDVEQRFEAVPAVMTTLAFSENPRTKKITSSTTMTTPASTTVKTTKSTANMGTAMDIADYDDTTAWEDGSGGGIDEESDDEDDDWGLGW